MSKHVGSCLCGMVKFEVTGDFDTFYLCYCDYCQKDTGSAHAANLFSVSARLTWLCGVDAVRSFTLPGTHHNKSFCGSCGSALPGTQLADLLVVPAGCLDSEIPLSPTARIFTSSRSGWEATMGDVPEFEGLPDKAGAT